MAESTIITGQFVRISQTPASIGERLHVAESTVKSHVKTILGKTGCRNRVELVIYALTTGLVRLQ